MIIKKIRDKDVLETHFRKNTPLNIYLLGDLDDFFFEYTEWFGLFESEDGELKQVALLYKGSELPVLLAFYGNEIESKQMKYLIENIKTDLPEEFYAHLSPGLKDVFMVDHEYEPGGRYLKMCFPEKNKDKLEKIERDSKIRRLKVSELDDILEFYTQSYPDNWFDKRMLETGKYFGFFDKSKPAAIAGIHVYSVNYRIAALGNIATDPAYRGKSICTKLTAELCRDLFNTTDLIGLNVHENNTAAIKCYEKIGFRIYAGFDECMFRRH
ncbi:MAG TPA: GNAT family N-acetyltransferase [Ignavibacteria bacterium]|nr:GNAT family N-acetyltransferase [Ignavibacteria bacterium]HMR39808.1 GNAT family N-acetyltransferase [Ignavibacteria bacterium]